jgi:fatty acid desaturase
MFGHTGMKICNQDKENDFILNTIRTCRNIVGDQLTTWLMGGLNYQIEHHLFQTIPRNNLKKSSEFIKNYINNIGEVYYETNVKTAYYEIYKTLNIKLK